MDFSKLAKSLNPYTIKKGFSYLKQYGFQEFKVRLSERFDKEEVDYNEWCKNDILTDEERKAQRERIWEYPPLISVVVPLYQTPEPILIKASNGASDFGNKFGQPLICGSVLTFEHTENNEVYGYDKVIMLAGGVGYGTQRDFLKGTP